MTRVDHYNEPDAPKANSIVIAVSAFVQDAGGRILMIKRTDNDLYALPGGRHELGETMTATALRETWEETGYVVEVDDLVGIYSNPGHVMAYDDGEVRQEFSICFRAHVVSGEARTSNESSEVVWVEPSELDSVQVHPSIRLRIDHALTREQPYYT
ncbi:NUDIX hydrolase [Actinomycetospora sp. TBRC 11914]|uniref:NUDIX hydrolase n=1 Tax=Actinomycetospora sp. TBRC 11914 TaxID=2729387 RepID=UPI00145C747F|nr:NUDIX domain-containing protein [Actinomycetospora sp. TBRC 11914]NMO90611.1 NUDIX domain-containing protein [Actinomycetospora sp. TBRC 11914]